MTMPLSNSPMPTVEMGRRIGARLILYGIAGVIYGAEWLALFFALEDGNYQLVALLSKIWLIPALGLLGVQIFVLVKHSTTLGGYILKLKYLDTKTGRPNPGLLFGKLVLQGLLESVTLGIVAISYLFTYRDGQHWLDRALNLVAVPRDAVPAATVHSSPPQALPPQIFPPAMPPSGGVTPVQLPLRTEAPSPMPPVMSFTPSQPNPAEAGPLVESAPSMGFPASPASPMAEPTPPLAPSAPLAPPAAATPVNPWAFAGGDDNPEPYAYDQPEAPSLENAWPDLAPFAPEGQAPIPPAPPVTSPVIPAPPVSPTPALTLSDETVIDPLALPTTPVVRFDDGSTMQVDGPIALGRNPVAPDDYPQARIEAIVDESMRMSKSHLVVLPHEGGVGVLDMGSRNGVVFESGDSRFRIASDQVIAVPVDTTVHFGGRSFVVQ